MRIKHPVVLKLLTVVSLLLLLIFLIFWNLDNYKREQSELKVELASQMELSCAEYKDSLIQGIFEIIDLDAKVRSIGGADTLFVPDENSMLHSKYDHIGKQLVPTKPDSNIVMAFEKNVSMFETSLDTAITVLVDRNHSNRKIMVWNSDIQGTAIKVKYEKDSVSGIDFSEGLESDTVNVIIEGADDYLPRLYVKIDTIFRKRLRSKNIHINHEIKIVDSDSVSRNIVIPFNYGSMFSQNGVAAVFDNYNNYLFRKIMSSLFISIGLFVIIALSFLAIVRSWLNQKRLMNIKNEFISNMTHELKTPIATVGVAIEALELYGAMDNPLKKKEYIDISKHELNRLKVLVDKVLKMSTIDQGFEDLLLVKLDLRNLVAEVLSFMKLHFDKEEVRLKSIERGSYFVVMGDRVHLTNVIYNLLDNAIKYSRNSPQVDVLLEERKNSVSVSITDRGLGIAKEYHSKVFERFFRVPSRDRHNVKGHGLGLHYVKTIIEKHHGEIEIASVLPTGTNISFVIPKEYD